MATTVEYGRRSITFIPAASSDINLQTIQNPIFKLGTPVLGTAWFVPGEPVSQTTSSATGVVLKYDIAKGLLWLSTITGTINTTDPILGGTGASHGIPTAVSYAYPNGIRLSDVRFTPSATADKVQIRGQGIATGPILFDILCPTLADSKRSVGGRSLREQLYIVYSECTFSTPGSCRIVFEYD